MDQTIVALFDNRADAEAAVAQLVEAGISRTSIGLTSGKGERYNFGFHLRLRLSPR